MVTGEARARGQGVRSRRNTKDNCLRSGSHWLTRGSTMDEYDGGWAESSAPPEPIH